MSHSRCLFRLLRLSGVLGAVAACASVHALPSPPPAPGPSPLPLKLEYVRLGVFTSVTDDVDVERVFTSPVDPRLVLVTATGPEGGVFATRDGGLNWSFAKLDLIDKEDVIHASDGSAARLFRDAIFDPAEPRRVYAWTQRRLLRSDDGGASWNVCPLEASGDVPVDSASLAGPTLLVASGRQLYSSDDAGHTFVKRRIRVEGAAEDARVRVRSIAVDPADPRRIALSLHSADENLDVTRRIASALDGTSDVGLAALSLVDSQDPRPQRFALGAGASGVLVSTDGGIEWQQSGLALDAWLVARPGVVYALAASPVLEAATLARERPAFADSVRDQMRGLRIDVNTVRAAFAFPGRQRLLLGPLANAPLFKSTDGGFTWVRVFAPEAAKLVALRPAIDEQRRAWIDAPVAAAGAARSEGGGGHGGGGGRGRGGRHGGGGGGGAQRQVRGHEGNAEATLAYIDPVRLLARYNEGRSLTSAATAGEGALLAFVPSEAYWSRLADEVLTASDAAGEISLGPGYPSKDVLPLQAFEVVRSGDDGASWEAASGVTLPQEKGRRPPPYPRSIASAGSEPFLVIARTDRENHVLQTAWRWVEPDQKL